MRNEREREREGSSVRDEGIFSEDRTRGVGIEPSSRRGLQGFTYLKKYGRGAGAGLTNGAAYVVALVLPDGALDTQTSVFRDGVVALIRVAGEH